MATGERPSGTSKTSTPSTLLPGLMSVRNDSLSGTFIIAAALSPVNSRPSASRSVRSDIQSNHREVARSRRVRDVPEAQTKNLRVGGHEEDVCHVVFEPGL